MEGTLIIGLTGNSGSGKSTVVEILKKNGIPVIECDEISRQVMCKDTPCYFEVLEFFGKGILYPDGNINRRLLGEIAFNDKIKLERLNQITHYHISKEVFSQIDEILSRDKKYKYMVIDVPLLIGSGLQEVVNQIWVVHADYDILTERLLKRDNISLELIEKRLGNQLSSDKLKGYADILIENNGDLQELEKRVNEILGDGYL